jgi:ribosomal protection tetracycline resistance protein
MKTELWIDGFNVIFADKTLGELARQDIHAAKTALIENVAEYAAVKGYNPLIFFDHKDNSGPVREEELLGVRIISGNRDTSADSLMEKMNFELSREQDVVLVTSDGLLKSMVAYRTGGSRLIEARDFNKELLESRAAGLKRSVHKKSTVKLSEQVRGKTKEVLERKRQGA